MSKLNEIISCVITDDEFRPEFLQDPIQDPMRVTESYDLTEEDIAELKSITLKEMRAFHEELEERISKSFMNLPAIGQEKQKAGGGHSNEYCHSIDGLRDFHRSHSSRW